MIRLRFMRILLFMLISVVLSILYIEDVIADVLSVTAEVIYPDDGNVLSKPRKVQVRSRHSGLINNHFGDQVMLQMHHLIRTPNGSIVHDSGVQTKFYTITDPSWPIIEDFSTWWNIPKTVLSGKYTYEVRTTVEQYRGGVVIHGMSASDVKKFRLK